MVTVVPTSAALFGPKGANDVKLHDGFLYLALKDRIVRWKLVPGTAAAAR